MNGQLFTQEFLRTGITLAPAWAAISDTELDVFIDALGVVYRPYSAASTINEAVTEAEIILPVLEALGWTDSSLPQVVASGSRREDVPDTLLFASPAAKATALQERRDSHRYKHALAVLEAKRWLRAYSAEGDRCFRSNVTGDSGGS